MDDGEFSDDPMDGDRPPANPVDSGELSEDPVDGGRVSLVVVYCPCSSAAVS